MAATKDDLLGELQHCLDQLADNNRKMTALVEQLQENIQKARGEIVQTLVILDEPSNA